MGRGKGGRPLYGGGIGRYGATFCRPPNRSSLPVKISATALHQGVGAGRDFLRGGFAKRQLRSTLTPAHNNEGDKNMCTNLHDNARQYAEEKK